MLMVTFLTRLRGSILGTVMSDYEMFRKRCLLLITMAIVMIWTCRALSVFAVVAGLPRHAPAAACSRRPVQSGKQRQRLHASVHS